jgi:hypothetical protein
VQTLCGVVNFHRLASVKVAYYFINGKKTLFDFPVALGIVRSPFPAVPVASF